MPAAVHPLFQPLSQELNDTLRFLQEMLPPEAPRLAEVSAYSLARPGKMVRPAMVHAMWQLATQGPSDEPVIKLAAITEMIHLATLLHDDVLDEAETRLGHPTVRQVFGNRMAILGGDWLLARASQVLASLGDVRLVKLYADVLAHLCEGEVLQQEYAFQPLQALSWQAYEKKTFKKTASLYTTAMEAVAILAGLNEAQTADAITFGRAFGMAFQIQDDVLDYTAEASAVGKPVLEDMRNGLANAPVLLAYQHPENRETLDAQSAALYALAQAEQADAAALEAACNTFRASLLAMGAVEETRQQIEAMTQEALAAIAPYPDVAAKQILTALVNASASRQN